MSEHPTIYELLPKVAASIGVVGKDKTNNDQNYRFRGIDDVVNAMHPALVEHGVFIAPVVEERIEEKFQTRSGSTWRHVTIRVSYTLYGPAGDCVELVAIGEGTDMGDKATNKAMSSAFKTVMGQAFTIPFDTEDSEAHEVEEEVQWWIALGWTTAKEHHEQRSELNKRSKALPQAAAAELKAKLSEQGITTGGHIAPDAMAWWRDAVERLEAEPADDPEPDVGP